MKKTAVFLSAFILLIFLSGCGSKEDAAVKDMKSESVLTYGSGDYTRINPAMDEHGEINILIFNGLTAHNGKNEVIPALAESWEYDEKSCTYTFHLEKNVTWHDGEMFTADDVRFTIEEIMDPDNGSENAPDFEDVEEKISKREIYQRLSFHLHDAYSKGHKGKTREIVQNGNIEKAIDNARALEKQYSADGKSIFTNIIDMNPFTSVYKLAEQFMVEISEF